MTRLTRTVRRVVTRERRDLVVLLHPGITPDIEIREVRRRSGPRVSLAWLYAHLTRRAAGLPAPKGR